MNWYINTKYIQWNSYMQIQLYNVRDEFYADAFSTFCSGFYIKYILHNARKHKYLAFMGMKI